ncbi:hypothetical protein INR49_019877, partial [Caranx melampygus]
MAASCPEMAAFAALMLSLKNAGLENGISTEEGVAELDKKGYGAITTEIQEGQQFYYAEDYHQQYLKKVPKGYCGLKGTGVSCPIGATKDELVSIRASGLQEPEHSSLSVLPREAQPCLGRCICGLGASVRLGEEGEHWCSRMLVSLDVFSVSAALTPELRGEEDKAYSKY